MQVNFLEYTYIFLYVRHCMEFLEFQHDVISVLVFGQDNEAHHDIPREENVGLTERHFVEQIPPTDSKQKAQKRCKVC